MDSNLNNNRGQSANLFSSHLNYQFGSDNSLNMGMPQPFAPFISPSGASSSANVQHMDWNPGTMLDNLSFIEEKIQQVKDVIRTMMDSDGQLPCNPGDIAQQQQAVNADLTCLIVQLISTAGSLLPSLNNSSFLSHPPAGRVDRSNHVGSSSIMVPTETTISELSKEKTHISEDHGELFRELTDGTVDGDIIETDNILLEESEQDAKDVDAVMDGDNLLPGSYELLQLEKDEILAPHTHFCAICGKGFKRDANLRMHMRGHGDEYKSPTALAKPPSDASAEHTPEKRYSCPFVGCKRNKLHKNFQPLKTILCVKNHYKRSHCEKSYTCSRCHTKKFSILADLKTHQKHCGQVKWLCSCGTSFSRKDKLFAHVGLFHGHTPALPSEGPKDVSSSDQAGLLGSQPEPAKLASPVSSGFMWDKSLGGDSALDIKGLDSCSDDFLSTANFGSFNFSFEQLDEFMGNSSSEDPDHFQSAQQKGRN